MFLMEIQSIALNESLAKDVLTVNQYEKLKSSIEYKNKDLKTEAITVLSKTCEEGILALKKSLESQFAGIDNNLEYLIYFAVSYKKVKLNEPFFPKNSFTYYNENSYQFFLFS
jgi:hypothetical protein